MNVKILTYDFGRIAYMMNMGERIRQKRKELNLTQQALAEKAGVNRVTVTGWEKDDYQPNGANLQALADALKCDPTWLVSGKGEAAATPLLRPVQVSAKEVPLISWVQAGTWTATDPGITRDEAIMWLYTTASVSDKAFALRVRGDSMTNPHGNPTIPEDSIVIVEPEIHDVAAINGKIVVAHIDGGSEATLKKFVEDFPHRYLVPLNPNYKTIECDGNCRIVGLVKQVIIEF
ncbi:MULTISPECIES: LexA family protein [Pantoea]|jgi:SOS-response transcriptional repressor LexA|nr:MULTISPECIES: S24 family peptidase [Pantoea]DAE10061.1 MAG TPA: Repressor protein CI [Siphoviridae sp. ct4sp3]MBZ6397238.1 helix-turn-helix domain-containing protein [Pantoea sp.]MBZ6440458.1 helix-turn-helix domain-containing protein [Pantoea sp.]MDH1088333.1 helix-turn-helix domain-containing protein [Pantoea brenneri]MDU7866735.1 S24 family peptidase [Pantoea sp.]